MYAEYTFVHVVQLGGRRVSTVKATVGPIFRDRQSCNESQNGRMTRLLPCLLVYHSLGYSWNNNDVEKRQAKEKG